MKGEQAGKKKSHVLRQDLKVTSSRTVLKKKSGDKQTGEMRTDIYTEKYILPVSLC